MGAGLEGKSLRVTKFSREWCQAIVSVFGNRATCVLLSFAELVLSWYCSMPISSAQRARRSVVARSWIFDVLDVVVGGEDGTGNEICVAG